MIFKYTYIGKLIEEINTRKKEIENLKSEVSDFINKEDYYHLRKSYDELIEKMETFESYKNERQEKIDNYILDNLNNFTRKVSNNDIKDKYGESMYSSMAFLMMTAISKNFPDLAYRYSDKFGNVFYHECIDEKDLSFIE